MLESRLERAAAARRLASYLACFYVAWTVRTLLYRPLDLQIHSELGKRLLAWSFFGCLMLAPVFLYLRYAEREKPLNYLRLTTRLPQALLTGAAISAVFFGAYYLYFGVVRGLPVVWRVTPLNSPFSLSVLSEEVLFRGFVQRKLEALLPFWKANLLQAALFTLVHWPGWLFALGYPPLRAAGLSINIFLLGLFFGYLTRRTGSLWPAILVHATNNLVVLMGLAGG